MKTLLIKYCPNWADEADFPGFIVMDSEDWALYLKEMEKYIAENGFLQWTFGTNEYADYSNFEEFKDTFLVREIDQNEKDVLVGLFDGYFGATPPQL